MARNSWLAMVPTLKLSMFFVNPYTTFSFSGWKVPNSRSQRIRMLPWLRSMYSWLEP
jgi:hypothetical protein